MQSSHSILALALSVSGLACGDSGAPGAGNSFFTVTLDGTSWTPDTVGGLLFGLTPDSGSLNLFAVRRIAGEEQTITLAIRHFPPTGPVTLADTSGSGIGAFSVIHTNVPGLPPPTDNFLSSSLHPGLLRFSGLSLTDSVVSGTFAFEAATNPDTLPHHSLSGRFRVQYSFQQVYLPVAR